MKVIDLINKIAKGEEVPKRIRIEHWCYKFEWVEHLENYYDEDNNIDLMSALSMNKEELNYKVKIIEEDKKIEKLNLDADKLKGNEKVRAIDYLLEDKINELIEEIEKLKESK